MEDLNDGRVHDNIQTSSDAIREFIPIAQISKLFYTNTGKLLNIGNETDSDDGPILLLKRDSRVRPLESSVGEESLARDEPPEISEEQLHQADIDKQLAAEASALNGPADLEVDAIEAACRRFPPHLDPEWIALEVFQEDVANEGSDQDDEDDPGEKSEEDNHAEAETCARGPDRSSLGPTLTHQIRNLSLFPSTPRSNHHGSPLSQQTQADIADDTDEFVARSPFGSIATSLSLIEMLICLAGLQEYQQATHLSIPDHVLAFFLEETSSTGLAGEAQWKARSEARRRMGFDPYTDSPHSQRKPT